MGRGKAEMCDVSGLSKRVSFPCSSESVVDTVHGM
jgi:hypothetical protein